MAGCGRNSGCGRRNPGCGCSGRGTGQTSTTSTTKSAQKGLCSDLEGNIFDIGQQTSADLLRMTLKKVIQYVGTKYGKDIANDLENRQRTTTSSPQHMPNML